MPLINCPDCNTTVSDAASQCVTCGCPIASVATRSGPAPAVYTAPARSAFDCPRCGASTTRKLSMVHAGGVSAIDTTTKGAAFAFGGGLGIGAARTNGVQVTALAEAAAPPSVKSARAGVALLIIGAILLTSEVTALGVILAAAGTFIIWRVRQYNTEVFPQLLDTWNRSYLCDRCGETSVIAA